MENRDLFRILLISICLMMSLNTFSTAVVPSQTRPALITGLASVKTFVLRIAPKPLAYVKCSRELQSGSKYDSKGYRLHLMDWYTSWRVKNCMGRGEEAPPHELETNSMELSPSWEAASSARISQYLMEAEGSLPCSQDPSTVPYPEPDKFSPYYSILPF
jgi:hypothetical protein